MLEITVSGRLSADPLEGSRTHVDGGHIPVVCTWLMLSKKGLRDGLNDDSC